MITQMQKEKKTSATKEMIGTVVSDKMDKTIVVEVGRSTMHPTFKKVIKKINNFKAHDEKNLAKMGDIVKIRRVRPLSKDKRWKLVEIVEKVK